MMQETEQITPPPSVVATISAGFDITAKHLWLTLIPVLLDVFLWLGPRLSFRTLVERMVAFWQQQTALAGFGEDLLLELAPRTNLFTSFSVPVIGVPTFVVGMLPEETPLVARVFEVESGWIWLLLFLLFNLFGLFLSALYLSLIAQVVREQTKVVVGLHTSVGLFLKRAVIFWLQLLALGFAIGAASFVLYIPLIIISTLLAMVSGTLATMALFVGPMMVLWLLFYLSLVPHGLVYYGRPILRAMLESFRLIQQNLLASMGMLVSILVINRILDYLLVLAEDGTWFTLVSIFGHGFITTALFVATFLFYRDRFRLFYLPQQTVTNNP